MPGKQRTVGELKYFKTPAGFRKWLAANHDKKQEVWLGIYKNGSGIPSITYPAALDEALCFGWIDGIRKSIDETAYTNRFTPRKPDSTWSRVNINRVGELTELKRMMPPGVAAFEMRNKKKSLLYSYERETAHFDAGFEKQFRANHQAWEFFQAQAPWYRRTATFWVISAKREETRRKRLATLIDDSASGRRLAMLVSKPGQKSTKERS
jgi:uncharacterized protein YdeI (YjbR/CyaY-like superfamily)